MKNGPETGLKNGKFRAYCRRCRHEQIFVRTRIHHGVHLFFTLATLGLWGVCWGAICLAQRFRPWRCEHCSWPKPEFRDGGDDRAEPKEAPVEGPGPRAA